jgi:hypothetical protein
MSKLIVEAELEKLRAERAALLGFVRRVRARTKGFALGSDMDRIYRDALEVITRFGDRRVDGNL